MRELTASIWTLALRNSGAGWAVPAGSEPAHSAPCSCAVLWQKLRTVSSHSVGVGYKLSSWRRRRATLNTQNPRPKHWTLIDARTPAVLLPASHTCRPHKPLQVIRKKVAEPKPDEPGKGDEYKSDADTPSKEVCTDECVRE